jgi:hypothetical protein
MNQVEGRIQIDLHPDKFGSERVAVDSSRPVYASRVMQGKSVHDVLRLLPLMYGVCGVAQARTSVAATGSALQRPEPPAVARARDLLVLLENLREHWFRILVDWSRLFDLPPQTDPLPQLGRLLPDFSRALFAEADAFSLDSRVDTDPQQVTGMIDRLEQALVDSVFHRPAADWLKIDSIDAVYAWARQQDTTASISLRQICDQGFSSQGFSAVGMMPALDGQQLCQRLDRADADQFVALPTWQDQCLETTPLVRQWRHPLIQALDQEFNNSLLTRWTSRLVELATIPGQLRALLAALDDAPDADQEQAPTPGLAQTEAARGRLVHRVEVDDTTVTRYRILAPTEWNFHPRGLVAQALGNLSTRDKDQLERLAMLMINAIDPCVDYNIRIH